MATKLVRRADVNERLPRARRVDEQADAFPTEAAEQDRKPGTSVQVAFEPAQDYAELLGIAPDDEMCVRDRVQRAGDVPIQLVVSRMPRSITSGTALEAADTGPGGMYARVEEHGYRLTDVEEIVTGGPIMAHERALLGEDIRVVLRIRRIVLAENLVVAVNDVVVPAERYELHVSFPAR